MTQRSEAEKTPERQKRTAQQMLKREFFDSIKDILYHPVVLEMKNYFQHCQTNCYQHCLAVAYCNFYICKALHLDAVSAARGGMLHDLFLYDWRKHSHETGDRFHAMSHPWTAYRTAKRYFDLNEVEKEVITKHMWPVTLFPPKYAETYVICFTDKYCGTLEIAEHYSKKWEHFMLGRKAAKLIRRISKKVPSLRELQKLVSELESIESAAVPLSLAKERYRSPSSWGSNLGSSLRSS